MLSRVAESLYWMSRYIERAENIARIVDVNLQLMLDVPSQQAQKLAKNWLPLVASLGDEETFRQHSRKSDHLAVTEYLIFDREHPNSIAGCLAAARENARTVREQISVDMWEQLNRSYLWFIGKSARQFFERNQYEFFQRIKKSQLLFQGITDNGLLHGEGWEFIQIGKLLERADKTSRLLDDEYHLLRQIGDAPNDQMLQWLAVLRCSNARQTYQRIYAGAVHPVKVTELLLLNEFLPRSVRFCVQNLDAALRRISGVSSGHFTNPAEKISGRLLADLSFSSVEDFCRPGLHQAMDDLQVKLNEIGSAIVETYIRPPLPPEPPKAEARFPVQTQQQ